MKEIWKTVPDWPPYEVSNLGRIRSYHKKRSRHNPTGEIPYVLKPIPFHNGRLYITLQNQGRRLQTTVHRLVLLTFVGPCPSGLQACHNDSNCQNNKLDNLRWDTPKANWEDARKHGTIRMGSKSPNAKLLEEEVISIRILYAKRISLNSLADLFGVGPTTIAKIVTGETWKHVGGPISKSGSGSKFHSFYLTPE